MEDGDFWNDPVVSQNKMKTLKSMKDDVATYEIYGKRLLKSRFC